MASAYAEPLVTNKKSKPMNKTILILTLLPIFMTSCKPDCKDLTGEGKEFIIQSGEQNRCSAYSYINLGGKVRLEIMKSEKDAKLYAWWNKGIFFSNSEKKVLINDIEILKLPLARGSLRFQLDKGTAKIRIDENIDGTQFNITTKF